MTRKQAFLIVGFLGFTVLGGLYLKKKLYDPKQQTARAIKEVAELSANNQLKDGDIIFQTSLSLQSKAIQLATHSKYSHCGLIFNRKSGLDDWCVLEAVQPVKWTPLSKWISRGDGGHYVIKRLTTDRILPRSMLDRLRKIAESYIGKDYDLYFGWGDDKIYCSELVWKSYYRLNKFKLGELQTLRDFDLTNPVVKRKMKERYGNNIPLDDTVISPVAIFNCDLLETVKADE